MPSTTRPASTSLRWATFAASTTNTTPLRVPSSSWTAPAGTTTLGRGAAGQDAQLAEGPGKEHGPSPFGISHQASTVRRAGSTARLTTVMCSGRRSAGRVGRGERALLAGLDRPRIAWGTCARATASAEVRHREDGRPGLGHVAGVEELLGDRTRRTGSGARRRLSWRAAHLETGLRAARARSGTPGGRAPRSRPPRRDGCDVRPGPRPVASRRGRPRAGPRDRGCPGGRGALPRPPGSPLLTRSSRIGAVMRAETLACCRGWTMAEARTLACTSAGLGRGDGDRDERLGLGLFVGRGARRRGAPGRAAVASPISSALTVPPPARGRRGSRGSGRGRCRGWCGPARAASGRPRRRGPAPLLRRSGCG